MNNSYKEYASKDWVNDTVNVALDSANAYTDAQIAAIPTPDVGGQIASAELITIADIDTICGASIVNASEVTY